MRCQESQLATRRFYTDNKRETVPAPATSEIYQRKPITLPSSLRKPSLRTYFNWDDNGNEDYAKRPALLDLFAGGGGAAMGYYLAGFRVVGIDINPQKHYPFEFHQADAMTYPLDGFDVIHASPPCQKFSIASVRHIKEGKIYPDSLTPIRKRLEQSGSTWIIENVLGAPMDRKTVLCGLMFNLNVFRHRAFESNALIFHPVHPSHNGKRIGEGYFSVAGGSGRWKSWGTVHRDISKGTIKQWREAMGIDWMTGKEIKEAIPPAYTFFIGQQLIEYLKRRTE